MCLLMEETEKQAVRRALVEERGRFCTFIGFLQPVVVREREEGSGGEGGKKGGKGGRGAECAFISQRVNDAKKD